MRRGLFFILCAFLGLVAAFDISSKSNVVLYWGQEGGTLASVCQDPSTDVIALAFLTTFFGTGGLPVINFAGSCNGPTFPGTDLLECDQIGQDIKTCQDAGKIVLLSLGGAIGDYGFSSSSEAESFATTVWNLFGGGTSSTRPFGSSIVDGFDLDIENNEPEFYSDFISASRKLFATGSKPYYISGAPQCVFPDASLGQALDSSQFDMVFVQFYNNPPCGVEGTGFNFDTWQNWATSSSPNKNVKVYVGVPASTAAAGSGYIPSSQLETVITGVIGHDNFGGIMMWDAVQAFSNVQNGVNYAEAAKNILVGRAGNSSEPSPSPATTPQHKTTSVAAGPSVSPDAATVATGTVVTGSPIAAGPSVSPDAATVATGTVVTGSPIAGPTTLQTVTQGTTTATRNPEKQVVSDTETQTSATPEPSATSSASPSSGSCVAGLIDCVGGQFAQCVDGQLVLTSCGEGTTCSKIDAGDGNVVVTCDYPTSKKLARNHARRHGHANRHVLVGQAHRGS